MTWASCPWVHKDHRREAARLEPSLTGAPHEIAKAGAFAYGRPIRSKDLFSLSTVCMSTVEGTPIEPGSWRKDFV